MSSRVKGQVILTTLDKNKIGAILELEQWLNDKIASEAYIRFGIGLRVHINSIETQAVNQNDRNGELGL